MPADRISESNTVPTRAELPRVTIVILARNAASTIARTVESVAAQDIFRPGAPVRAAALVVVNGSDDSTGKVATEAWAVARAHHMHTTDLQIAELPEAGKANAWNGAVHRFSDPATDLFVFLDADVWFEHDRALQQLLAPFAKHPEVIATTAVGKKDVSTIRSWIYRAVVSRTSTVAYGSDAIPGSCYALRGPFVRTMELPIAITIEDGFLHAMVVTLQFTDRADPRRLRCVTDVAFVYEPKQSFRELFDHERRLIIGGSYNAYAFRHFHEVCRADRPAGSFIMERNVSDATWIAQLIAADRRRGRRWLVPTPYLTRRLRPGAPRPAGIRGLVLVAAATAADAVVSISANSFLRSFDGSLTW